MASLVLGYVPGSGFVPLFHSGNIFSGRVEPVGGCQVRAWPSNSGAVYISLSGGNVFSGQWGTLPASGGPTITSGAMPLSGGPLSGICDGIVLQPGDSYFVPRIAFQTSGLNQVCAGCDAACSGQARLFWEMY
jgi:hypothetical protein